jgi:geranylgeranyl diphosphate synthase, type II
LCLWGEDSLLEDLKVYLKQQCERVDAALDRYLPQADAYPPIIHESMRYSVFAGGKRLRPILVLMAAELCGKDPEHVMFAAAAIEMIHTYSLIHDDLPAMDNDDLRRGLPTNHKKFGEDIAILAGDALLTLAFQVMTDPQHTAQCHPAEVLRATYELAAAAGTLGMVGGQVMDMQAERRPVSLTELEYIHRHKTGKLLTGALRIGSILAEAGDEALHALTVYGEQIGLAFQIADDILDLEGSTEALGKPAKSDLQNQKATYPALYGIEASKAMASKLINDAKFSLQIFRERATYLHLLADFIIARTH